MRIEFRSGRTVVTFSTHPDISNIIAAWAAHDLVKEAKGTEKARTFSNAAGFGTRELYRTWNIAVGWSLPGQCRIEGWAQRRGLDISPVVWLVPKEIPLDVSALDETGYSGAADEGRKQLNRLLAMLGQPRVPTHRGS